MDSEHESNDVTTGGDARRDSSPPPSTAVAGAQRVIAEVLHTTLTAQHRAGNAGATYEAVARRIGGSKQHVGEACDPLSGRTLSLTKAVLLGATIAPAFLRSLAARIESDAGHRADLRDATMAMQESTGSVAKTVRIALADGVVTDAEGADIEAALLAAEADIAATRAALAQHRARRGVR